MDEKEKAVDGGASIRPPWKGTLINYMGLSKINTRGILSADKKMLCAASAYNLKKCLNFCSNKRKTAALVAPKPAVAALFYLFLQAFALESKLRNNWC